MRGFKAIILWIPILAFSVHANAEVNKDNAVNKAISFYRQKHSELNYIIVHGKPVVTDNPKTTIKVKLNYSITSHYGKPHMYETILVHSSGDADDEWSFENIN